MKIIKKLVLCVAHKFVLAGPQPLRLRWASLAGEGKSACSTAASSALPTPPPADESPLVGVARRAKEASRVLMATSHESRNAVLAGVQELLRERREDILAANQKDLDAATESG